MATKIPNSVAGAVASVLASYYYSHSRLNTLFMESGAPGDVALEGEGTEFLVSVKGRRQLLNLEFQPQNERKARKICVSSY